MALSRAGPAARWQRLADALVPIDLDAAVAVLRYSAVLTALGGVVLGIALPRASAGLQLLMVVIGLALAGAYGWSARQRVPHLVGVALLATMASTVLVLLGAAVVSGLGLHSISLGLIALVIAVTGAMVGTGAALALTLLAVSGVVGLGLWSRPGDSALATALAPWNQQRLVSTLFILLCGAWSAIVLGTVLRRNLGQRERRESMYRRLFSRSASALVLQRDWRILEANEAAARLFGYTRASEMLGLDLSSFYEADQLERLDARMALLATDPDGAPLEPAEFRLRSRGGQALFVTSSAAGVMLEDGPAIEVLYLDVGELRQQERGLLRSEAMLSRLFAASPDCISLADVRQDRFVMVNRAFEQVTGYAAAEVVGRTAGELRLWQHPADYAEMLARLDAHGSVDTFNTTLADKRGRVLTVRISAALFTVEGRLMRVTNWRDVTAVERTRLEYEAILQTAPIGIAYVRAGRFLHGNRRCEQMFGCAPGELPTLPGAQFWASEADHRHMREAFGPLLARGEPVDDERVMKRRDGSTFYCRVRAQAIDPHHPSQGGAIWLFEDISERRRVDEALALARDAAESASKAKSAFLANLSHEIRTPLNALIGLIGLAQQEAPPAAGRLLGYLKPMLDSAESLSAIVSDTLDLSKIEAGRFTLELRPFSLAGLLRSAEAGWAALAQARGLDFELQMPPAGTDWVSGDALRVRQILGNYVANALKFTPSGTVRVSLARAGGEMLRFEVSDTGPGIPEATQARLFQPFTQADDSTTRRYGGTGLGLSVCRELAGVMGGEVGVRSVPGQGSCFWVTLPLPAVAAPPVDVRGDADRGEALAGLRVLVAEDNEVNMLITATLLSKWGAEVVKAADGREAVARVHEAVQQRRPFDLVLMDVQMPVMDGHEASRALRLDFDRETLPIVALTASVLVSEREQGLAAGMNAFLAKPVNARQLRDTVGSLARSTRPAEPLA